MEVDVPRLQSRFPSMNSTSRRILAQTVFAFALTSLVAFTHGVTVTEAWKQRFEFAASGSSASVDAAGNVLAVIAQPVDNHFRIHAAKYAAGTGAVIWEKDLSAEGATDPVPVGIVVDSAGNALIAGWVNLAGHSSFYTLKLSAADGALLWDHLNTGPTHTNEVSWAIALDAAGNAVVAGNSQSALGGLDAYTVKYSATDGAQLWEHRFD